MAVKFYCNMKPSLSKKQANWLIYLGGVLLPLSFIFIIFSYDENHQINSREVLNTKFELFVILSIFIAPLLEEFVFRGFFSKKKLIKIFSLISTPLFILYFVENPISYYVLPFYLISCIFYFFKSSKLIINLIYLLNAFLFSIVHYKIADFSKFSTSTPFLIQFSSGLILVWIVINYSLMKAILFHFLWNFILVGLLFISIQFVESDVKKFEEGHYTISIEKVPRYPSRNTSLSYSSNGIVIKYMELREIHKIMKGLNTNDVVVSSVPFLKYNVEIEFYEKMSQDEMNRVLIKHLLENGFLRN